MYRSFVLAYGLLSYVVFLATFVYLAGFLSNVLVPKSIDSGVTGPFATALLGNLLLVMIFAMQHSVMARPGFKRWWTRKIPQPIERSTYVLLTNLTLMLLFWQWQPMGGVVWDVPYPAVRAAFHAVCLVGWLTILVATCMIHHGDLFGLRQVWLYYRGEPYTHLEFMTPGLYQWVRHPLYVGWMMAFWATPTMSVAHLLFAVAMTGYMLAAIPWEEHDLLKFHGEKYAAYCRRVPRLIPARKRLGER